MTPPVLTHGDLWRGNVVSAAGGEPVFVDPAVCWMWAEADLSSMYCAGGTPACFFDAYREVRALGPGWRERMPLLHLRELLSTVAHFACQRGKGNPNFFMGKRGTVPSSLPCSSSRHFS